jgi:hypothetical protein
MALVLLLAMAGTVAVVQSRRLGQARQAVAELRDQRDEARERASELAAAAPSQGGATAVPEEVPAVPQVPGLPDLGEMLEDGGLEDLLGGGFEDLLGGGAGAPDLAGCLEGVEDLPDVGGADLPAQVDEVAEAVEALRGHAFPEPVEPELQDDEEIRDVFADEVARGYPAEVAEQDRRLLTALRAVPPDIDLVAVQTELLGDQVAGYYDDTDQQLVVRADDPDEPLGGVGLLTLAHELDHALVDATIGLPPLDGYGDDEDGAYAALAVVEGGAVGLQTQFQVAALDPMSLLGDLGALLGASDGLDEVPAFIASSLTFPYTAGASYACGLHARGGWPAVDAALAEPPATTHAVLFPGVLDRVVDPADAPGPDGYALATRRTFGAAPLGWLFAAPGDDPDAALPDAEDAVRPWRGGEVALFTDGGDSAVALALSGAGLCDPVAAWWQAATAATGGTAAAAQPGERLVAGDDVRGWGVLVCDGEDVRLGIARTADLARATLR